MNKKNTLLKMEIKALMEKFEKEKRTKINTNSEKNNLLKQKVLEEFFNKKEFQNQNQFIQTFSSILH